MSSEKSASPLFEMSLRTWNSLSNETAPLVFVVIPVSLVLQVHLDEMAIPDPLVQLVPKVLLVLLAKSVHRVLRVAEEKKVKRVHLVCLSVVSLA